MDRHLAKYSDGHLLKKTTRLVKHWQCGWCNANATPQSLQVVFSGITACTSCVARGGSEYVKYTVTGTINDTFVVPAVGMLILSCAWADMDVGLTINRKIYTTSDCSGTPTDDDDFDAGIIITVNQIIPGGDTYWEVRYGITDPYFTLALDDLLFTGGYQFTGDNDCDMPPSAISNDQTSCGGYDAGEDGTATLSLV